MKYSKSAIGLLTREYRAVLKKCLLINLGLFALGAIATPANAEDVTNATELNAALATTGEVVNVTGNITDITGITGVKADSLNLNGNTISGATSGTAGYNFDSGTTTFTGGGTVSGFNRPDPTPASVHGDEAGALFVTANGTLNLNGGEWTFSNNNAGLGAVANTNGSFTANVDSITFSGNKSNSQTAGFRHQVTNNTYSDSKSSIIADSITFSDNEITSDSIVGGSSAVFNSGGTLELLGATNTFTGNKMNATVDDSRKYKVGGGAIDNQSHEYSGGAIDSTLVIGTDSSVNTFSDNSSSTNGGAIMNRAVDTDGNATLTLNGTSTFTGNSTDGAGGAIYNAQADGRTSTLNINGEATFTNNTANGDANDLYNAGTANLNAAEGKAITFNSGINGDGNGILNVKGAGTTVFNSVVESNNIKLASGATFTTGEVGSINSGSIDLRNENIDSLEDIKFGGDVNLYLDADATADNTDTITKATGSTGSLIVKEIQLLNTGAGSNKKHTLNFGDVTISDAALTALATEIGGTATADGGAVTFTQGNEAADAFMLGTWSDGNYIQAYSDETSATTSLGANVQKLDAVLGAGFTADNTVAAAIAGKVATTDFETYKGEVTDALGLKANAADVYTKTAANALLDAKANTADLGTMAAESADDYYTKTAANALLDAKANTADLGTMAAEAADDYYTKTAANALLDAKANTADLGTMAAESADNYYTKTAADALLGAKADLTNPEQTITAKSYKTVNWTVAEGSTGNLLLQSGGKNAAILRNTGSFTLNGTDGKQIFDVAADGKITSNGDLVLGYKTDDQAVLTGAKIKGYDAVVDAVNDETNGLDTKFAKANIKTETNNLASTDETVYSAKATDALIQGIATEAGAAWEHAEGWMNTALGIDSAHNDANKALQAALIAAATADGKGNNIEATSFAGALHELDVEKLAKFSEKDGATLELENTDGFFTASGISGDDTTGYLSNQLTVNSDQDGIVLKATDNRGGAVGVSSKLEVKADGVFYDDQEVATLVTAADGAFDKEAEYAENTIGAAIQSKADASALANYAKLNEDATFDALTASSLNFGGKNTADAITTKAISDSNKKASTLATAAAVYATIGDLKDETGATLTVKDYVDAGDTKALGDAKAYTESFLEAKTGEGETGFKTVQESITDALANEDNPYQTASDVVDKIDAWVGHDKTDGADATGLFARVADIESDYLTSESELNGANLAPKSVTRDKLADKIISTEKLSNTLQNRLNGIETNAANIAAHDALFETDTSATTEGVKLSVVDSVKAHAAEGAFDADGEYEGGTIGAAIQSKADASALADYAKYDENHRLTTKGLNMEGSQFTIKTADGKIVSNVTNGGYYLLKDGQDYFAATAKDMKLYDENRGITFQVMNATGDVYSNGSLTLAKGTDDQAVLTGAKIKGYDNAVDFLGVDVTKDAADAFEEAFADNQNIWVGNGEQENPTSFAGALRNIDSALGKIHGLANEDGTVNSAGSIVKDGKIASAVEGIEQTYGTNLKVGTSVEELEVSLDNAIINIQAGNTIVGKAYADQNGNIIDETYAALGEDVEFGDVKAASLNFGGKNTADAITTKAITSKNKGASTLATAASVYATTTVAADGVNIAAGDSILTAAGKLDTALGQAQTAIGAINDNIKVDADGNYISAGSDVAGNLVALDGQVKANADEIARVNGELVNTNTVLGQVSGALSGLNDAVAGGFATLNTELGNTNTSLHAAEDRIGAAETRIGAAETRIGAAETRIGAAETRIGAAEADIIQNKADIESLSGRMDGAEERIGAAETRIGAAETRIGAAETRIGAAETRIGAAETRIGAAEEAIGAINDNITVTDDGNYILAGADVAGNLVALDTQVKANADAIDAANERIGAAETRIGAAEERIGAAETRIGAAETRIGDAETRIGAAEERIGKTEEAIEDVRAEIHGDDGEHKDIKIGDKAATIVIGKSQEDAATTPPETEILAGIGIDTVEREVEIAAVNDKSIVGADFEAANEAISIAAQNEDSNTVSGISINNKDKTIAMTSGNDHQVTGVTVDDTNQTVTLGTKALTGDYTLEIDAADGETTIGTGEEGENVVIGKGTILADKSVMVGDPAGQVTAMYDTGIVSKKDDNNQSTLGDSGLWVKQGDNEAGVSGTGLWASDGEKTANVSKTGLWVEDGDSNASVGSTGFFVTDGTDSSSMGPSGIYTSKDVTAKGYVTGKDVVANESFTLAGTTVHAIDTDGSNVSKDVDQDVRKDTLATVETVYAGAENAHFTAADGATGVTKDSDTLHDAIMALDSAVGTMELNTDNKTFLDEDGEPIANATDALNALDGVVGNINELEGAYEGNLADKGSDIATHLAALDERLGGIKALNTDDYSNLADEDSSVDEHFMSLDSAIGNRTTDYRNDLNGAGMSNGYVAEGAADKDIVTMISEVASNIGTAADIQSTNHISSTATVNGNLSALDAAIGNLGDLNEGTIDNRDLVSAINSVDNRLTESNRVFSEAIGKLDHNYRELRHHFEAGMAGQAALSALVPNAKASGSTQLAVGTGAYKGHTAAAVGGFHWFTDNLLFNAGVAWDNAEATGRMGITYSW